jgi:glycosyltransferase involved in cell wall biosynthesis
VSPTGELRVGAVVPARNYERYVGEAIDSLLAQSLPVESIVVVDDGSTDRTAAIAEAYGPPVKVVRTEHAGAGTARSRGVASLVAVDAVAMLDADDLVTPNSSVPRPARRCLSTTPAECSRARPRLHEWVRSPRT